MDMNINESLKKGFTLVLSFVAAFFLLAGCGMKVSKTALKVIVSSSSKVKTATYYADSCENRIGVPYVEGGAPGQVVDIYYADKEVRKDAVLIVIHGGFYVGGDRRNSRPVASVFLKEGFDVVLLEYRLNDGKLDVGDELGDCAAALDFLTLHARELGLNPDRMFLTGDSAGGHLALYMAEGSEDRTLPIHPRFFVTRGTLLNCPAYDYASFSNPEGFTASALEWFIGPRYQDHDWLVSVSPRTFLGSYTGPLFLSTCTRDFIRSQSLTLKADCDALGRPVEFVDIESDDRAVGHVHNVVNPNLPESRLVNDRMIAFINRLLNE